MFLGPSLGSMPMVPNGQNGPACSKAWRQAQSSFMLNMTNLFSLLKPSIYMEDQLDTYFLREPAVFVSKDLLQKEQKTSFGWGRAVSGTHCFSHHLPRTPCPHFMSKSINTQYQVQDLELKLLSSITESILMPFPGQIPIAFSGSLEQFRPFSFFFHPPCGRCCVSHPSVWRRGPVFERCTEKGEKQTEAKSFLEPEPGCGERTLGWNIQLE